MESVLIKFLAVSLLLGWPLRSRTILCKTVQGFLEAPSTLYMTGLGRTYLLGIFNQNETVYTVVSRVLFLLVRLSS